MRKFEVCYAVEMTGLRKRKWLALGDGPGYGPELFDLRRDALKFLQKLLAEGFKDCRVVRVNAEYIWD